MTDALETDLYQLTMMAGYWAAGATGSATFELFVRRMPPSRSYLVAAGVDDALEFLERVRFDDSQRSWLKRLPVFARTPAAFFDDYLANFRFNGDVWGLPEGTPVFANEPILRVTAPLPEAQFAETALLAIVSFQTSVASKACRIVEASAGRPVVEFGARRAHGTDAALLAARAAFIGGCAGTSLVEAARRFGIPPSGTMAHSWVQAFASEDEAFRAFNRLFPDAVYLLDTYDTVEAARLLVASGIRPAAVRLDSGDLGRLSREVRHILDTGGLRDTRIFATGDLDEHSIAALVGSGAPVDAFGVGTALSTVVDAPALSAVYKLVEVERTGQTSGVVKLSPGKQTWPGPKQVWRTGAGDTIAAADEPAVATGTPLLQPMMVRGGRIALREDLTAVQARCRREVGALPADVRRLDAPAAYPVHVSDRLESRRRALAEEHVQSGDPAGR